MDFAYYILTPFALLLNFFYNLFNSYGMALILFALVVKLILYPFSLKGKRSMIQMNLLSGQLQKLQKQYGKDQARYNEEMQKLYARENVNPMSGCLWTMVPLFVLFPLYAIIRQPMKYLMGMTTEQMVEVGNSVLNWAQASVDMGWVKNVENVAQNLLTADTLKAGYNQLYLSSLITPENLSAVQAAAGETAREIFPISFGFLGTDLSQIPQLKFWEAGLSWAAIGLFLIPVISAVTSIIFSMVSTRTNSMNRGEQSEQAKSTNRTMMLITPIMSLWIGFSMPAALSIYWIANNVLGMLQEVISAKVLKKDYEKADELRRQRELEEKEEEKRLRREKAEERARLAEENRKNKGKKKSKDEESEKIPAHVKEASRVGIRQYARGRAYDPDRYGGVTPYHEDVAAGALKKAAEAEEAKGEETAAPTVEETTVETVATPAGETVEAPVTETVAAEAEETPAADESKED